MDEPYGTDAERRLGSKTKQVAARLSSPEFTRFTQVVEHLGTTPSLWLRHAVLSATLEGARQTTHDVLRTSLREFRVAVPEFGKTVQTVHARVQGSVAADFHTLLEKLAPVVRPSLALRWALWTQGASVLQQPSKAAQLRAYNDVHRQVYEVRAVTSPDVRPVTGYITEKDLT